MARQWRSAIPYKNRGLFRPPQSAGTGALVMSLVLSPGSPTVIPAYAPRPIIRCQAVNRAGNFHHKPGGPPWQTWPPRPPMPPSTL